MSRLLNVPKPLLEERHDVLVVERVEHLAPRPARSDKTKATEKAQLMGDGGFAQADERRQLADAQLTMGERVEQADPRRVAEQLERLGEGFDRLGREQRPPTRGQPPLIAVWGVTAVVGAWPGGGGR